MFIVAWSMDSPVHTLTQGLCVHTGGIQVCFRGVGGALLCGVYRQVAGGDHLVCTRGWGNQG